jgi:hypothetical protein
MRFTYRDIWRSGAASLAFALTLFLAPYLLATADEFAALWIGDADRAPAERIVALEDDSDFSLSPQDLFTFGDMGPPLGSPGSMILDPGLQAALDDAIRDSEMSELETGAGGELSALPR